MVKKLFVSIFVVLFVFNMFALAKEASDIEGMLNKAKNIGLVKNIKTFRVCLPSENSEALFKFRVKSDGTYIIYALSNSTDFEGRLLSRNFNYALVVDCTDFNIKTHKRFFNCKEELRRAKTYYLYFNPTGSPFNSGCVKVEIKKFSK